MAGKVINNNKIFPVMYRESDNSVLTVTDYSINMAFITTIYVEEGKNTAEETMRESSSFSFGTLQKERFTASDRCLILSNEPIPKNSRVYIEIEIYKQPSFSDLRHLAMSVGVHKDPSSSGVLVADHCMGNIFYARDEHLKVVNPGAYLAYTISERYNLSTQKQYQFIQNVTSKVPIINSVVGIGVDMPNNTITLFCDGKKFYSFSPQQFHLNTDPGRFYFAMYNNVHNDTVEGLFNLGLNGVKYKPSSYFSMYEEYVTKKNYYYDLESVFTVDSIYKNKIDKEIEGEMIAENDIAPVIDLKRDIYLLFNHPEKMQYVSEYKRDIYNNIIETVINHQACNLRNNTDTVRPDTAIICYPMPAYQQVYFEFICNAHNASLMNNEYSGIPLSIGITNALTDDRNIMYTKAIKINLFKKKVGKLKVYYYKDDQQVGDVEEYDQLNPYTPGQGTVIGVLLDLAENKITLYTKGTKYLEITSTRLDFTSLSEHFWFFFESAPGVMNKDPECMPYMICTFGDPKHAFKYDELVDDKYIMGLWYYYNYTIKEKYSKDIEIYFKVVPKNLLSTTYIYIQMIIDDKVDEYDGPGLNTLFKTHNTVTDTTAHRNVPNKTIFDLNTMIKTDSNSRN